MQWRIRFWGWLLAKLFAAALVVTLVWKTVSWFLPPPPGGLLKDWPRFGSDFTYTFALFLAGIFGFLLAWWCVSDQTLRCRVCARRLRMPVVNGNYSSIMLAESPYVEYICTFGHGKLLVPALHVSSAGAMRWVGYKSLWENLQQADREAAGKRSS